MEILNYDIVRQQVPGFFYQRFRVQSTTHIFRFLIPLDYGYGYLLRRIMSKWDGFDVELSQERPTLDIEMIKESRGRRLSNLPFPLRLISTPAEAGVQISLSPAPVDQDGFGVNFPATPVKNKIVLNEYYHYRETLHLAMQYRTAIAITSYVDILLDGYLIPEKSLAMWR